MEGYGNAAEESIGQKIRGARESRGITLDELASRTGLTKSFISQIERGKSNPSLSSLRAIVQELGIPMVGLFDNEQRSKIVVRKDKRKSFSIPDSILKFELLSPDLTKQMEVVRVIAPVGGHSEYFTHEGEECGYVIRGHIRLTVGDKEFTLEEGDSAYFSSKIYHGWINDFEEEAELIWIITPPSF